MSPIIEEAGNNVGGIPVLAGLLNITRQAIYQWSKVPHQRVLEVARLTGVPPHRLRPDLYQEPQTAVAL